MIATQRGIYEWNVATFGPAKTDFRVAVRANEELAELLRAISTDRPPAEVIEEAADVAIVLCTLACRREVGAYPTVNCTRFPPTITVEYIAAWAASKLAKVMMDSDAGAMRGVVGAMAEICLRLGGKLDDAVDAKMVINRARVWKRDGWAGDGQSYHVRDGEAAAGPARAEGGRFKLDGPTRQQVADRIAAWNAAWRPGEAAPARAVVVGRFKLDGPTRQQVADLLVRGEWPAARHGGRAGRKVGA